MQTSPEKFTELLQAVAAGKSDASESLFSAVYDELHRVASGYMGRERANHTLQPTALIHEAFIRLTKPQSSQTPPSSDVSNPEKATPPFADRDHFIATASIVMRRILVNHAKTKQTQKRGGDRQRVMLDDVTDGFAEAAIDLLALDKAMDELATHDETQHRLVELRFFGGMTTQQAARILGISERAAYYEWAHAKAWLKNEIENG